MFNNYKIIIFILFFCFSVNGYSFEIKTPLEQGSLFYGTLHKGEKLYLKDKLVQSDSDGRFWGALPTWAEENIDFTVIKEGKKEIKTFSVKKRTWKEEIVNGLPPKKITPDTKDTKRIQSEAKQMKNARQTATSDYFPTCFVRPVLNFKRISSSFGSKRVLNGIKTAGHSGTDYAAVLGTPVFSPADGIIKLTHQDMFYSGKTILIDHGYGIFSSYSHLNDIYVTEGQIVKQGEKIGTVGTTGRSTGPHLHFVISWYDVRVDPEKTLIDFYCKIQK